MHSFLGYLSFSRLRSFYQQANGDRSELKRLFITLRFLQVTISGILVFTFIDAFFGLPINLFLDLVALTLFLASLLLVYRHYQTWSKYLLFITVNAVLLLTASSQGREAGNSFIFFPVITGILTLFSYQQWRSILFCLAITIGTFLLLELSDYSYLKNQALPTSYQYVSYLINLIISIIMISYFTYYHAKANTQTENKLKKLNARLNSQNAKLKKTNSELDSFVYKASHDLRSPLTSLLGLIHLSRLESNLESLKDYGQMQEKLIRKLDTYIQDILAISRNSNLEVRREAIHFETLFQQSLEQLQYIEQYARIEKIIHFPANTPGFYSDPHRISIVLNNLLANAIRYADYSKQSPNFQIDITILPHQAIIKIFDNGIGIGESHLKNIFKMFYRATDKASGSGLGLYMVQEIIQKLQGTIEVSSQEGEWTQFEICLPNLLPTTPFKGEDANELQETTNLSVYA